MIASLIGTSGDNETALQLLNELLLDQKRVLGIDHPKTLSTRADLASYTLDIGMSEAAIQLYNDLLLDQERVMGMSHRHTLRTRKIIASIP